MKLSNLKFESPAEREIFPIINTLTIKNKIKLEYQKKFGFQAGGYSSFEEWCNDNGHEYNGDGMEDWNDSSWDSEKYRADFVLEKEDKKLIIEIDGEAYHQNKQHEIDRDNYFRHRGYCVYHIPASDTIINKSKIRESVLRYFTEDLNLFSVYR